MAGIGFTANQAWTPEVYVKYGIVNRIPVMVSRNNTNNFVNGAVCTMTAPYEIQVGSLGANTPVMGLVVAQNQAPDFAVGVECTVSVMLPTPGAVVTIPLSAFDQQGQPDATNGMVPLYYTKEGLLTTNTKNAVSSTTPFAFAIASDQVNADIIFNTVSNMSGYATL